MTRPRLELRKSLVLVAVVWFISPAAAHKSLTERSCPLDNILLQRSSFVSQGRGNSAVTTDNDLSEPVSCPRTGEGQTIGALSSRIDECSGLVASRKNKDLYWTHNDSGGRARLFAIDIHGSHKQTVYVDWASAKDWEDIASGPGPLPGEDYIYIGDFGDNNKRRSSIQIYRLLEPKVDGKPSHDMHVSSQRFEVKYPDGARDCEAIFVDQGPAAVSQGTSGRVYVITKHYNYAGDIYWVDLPETPPSSALTFTKGPRLNHGGSGWSAAVTAADINPQGTYIVVRSYDQLTIYPRQFESSVSDAVQDKGCQGSRRIEKQGESIAFGLDGSHYITVSEGKRPPVYYFALGSKVPAPIPAQCGGVVMRDVDRKCPLEDGSGCKVLADNMKGKTCGQYCEMHGLECANGWEEYDETCEAKVEDGSPVELGCDKPYGTTSDLLCQCVANSSS